MSFSDRNYNSLSLDLSPTFYVFHWRAHILYRCVHTRTVSLFVVDVFFLSVFSISCSHYHLFRTFPLTPLAPHMHTYTYARAHSTTCVYLQFVLYVYFLFNTYTLANTWYINVDKYKYKKIWFLMSANINNDVDVHKEISSCFSLS